MDAFTILSTAGWYPGRRVDIQDDVRTLEAEGFTVTPAAKSFLREFSGLRLALPEDSTHSP